MYDFIGIYQEMICIGVLGVVGITTLVQSKFWNKNKRNIGDMLLGIAVVMPAVFTYTLEHNVMRFAQAAVRVWGCQMDFADPKRTALEGIEALRNFLISIGMPKNFAELGAKEEDIEKLAHTCCYGDVNTGTVEGFATLDQKDVENIYKLMVF